MTTRAETIARLLNQAGTHLKNGIAQPMVNGCIDAAMNCVHQALLETLGPVASPAPAAEGPWVVRVLVCGSVRWHSRTGPAESFLHDASTYETRAEAFAAAGEWGAKHLPHVLPLAEAERTAAAAELASLPAHTRKVLAELANEEPSAEVLAMDDSPDEAAADISATLRREECERKAARQAKPAGWDADGPAGWIVRNAAKDGTPRFHIVSDSGRPSSTEPPYVWRSKAAAEHQRDIWTGHGYVVLPVDAAGNVIEAAAVGDAVADRNGTMWLEAERALRRLVATTTMERDEARTELATVKAERDDLEADRDKWAANAGTLNRSLRQVHTESVALRAALAALRGAP